ncbi:hypothetical protein ACFWIN_03440 [Streptomyces sp. NPDC127049]|uniref:hypothetical protein n=1 Tax=Streptomyces sp. NPDC127049 TaxID=3347118 RepID=UPI00364C4361
MGKTDANGVDLSGVAGRLVQTVDLVDPPAPQAIATDTVNDHVFVLQVESGAGATGNLCLNRISRTTGKITGWMRLTGFGHGLSMGCVPVGLDSYLWTECGDLWFNSKGVPFGSRVTRFRFEHEGTLDAGDIPESRKFAPPGSIGGTGPSYDPTTDRLMIAYHTAEGRKFTRYDATRAAAGDWTAIDDAAPRKGGTTVPAVKPPGWEEKQFASKFTSQGFQLLGDVLYTYDWLPYDRNQNGKVDPEDFPGITYISSYDWKTGERADQQIVTGASGLTRREPEGLAVERDPETQETRLLFGFSNTVPGTTGSRDVTICWYPTKPAVDGVKVLADWTELTPAVPLPAGAERPSGRIVVLAGTPHLQLRGTLTGTFTEDSKIATLPHRLRPTRQIRQNVARNNSTGRCVCRVEGNIRGELWVYGAYDDNPITWIDLNGVSVPWH